MSRGRDNLGKNSGPQAVLYLDNDEDFFEPSHGWGKATNHYRDFKFHTPTQGDVSPFGATTRFSFNKLGDLADRITLEFTLSALTVTGGTFRRWHDFAGYALINRIEIDYQTNNIKTITGDELHSIYFLKQADEEERQQLAQGARGFLTIGQRNAAAAGAQVVRVEIPVDWSEIHASMKDHKKHYPAMAMPHPLDFNITWRTLAQAVETDGTVPVATMTAIRLRSEWIFIPEIHRTALTDRINFMPKPGGAISLQSPGLIYKISRIEAQLNAVIAAADVQHVAQLRNVRNPVYAVIFTIRRNVDVTTDLGNNFFNYQPWTSYRFLDSGEDITETIDLAVQREHIDPYFWPGMLQGTLVGAYPFCINARASVHHSLGVQDLGRYNNPALEINFAAPGQQNQLDIYFLTHNILIFTQGNLYVRYK